MNFRFLVFLLLVLVLPVASSFGVTPAQRVFDYQPGTEQRYSFEVVNSEGKKVNLAIIPQGELLCRTIRQLMYLSLIILAASCMLALTSQVITLEDIISSIVSTIK